MPTFLQLSDETFGVVLINPMQITSITSKVGEAGCQVRLTDGNVYSAQASALKFAGLVHAAMRTTASEST